jgi:hypothetical protein
LGIACLARPLENSNGAQFSRNGHGIFRRWPGQRLTKEEAPGLTDTFFAMLFVEFRLF